MWDKMGIPKDERLTGGRLAVPDLPSIALGAVDITLLQLTSAYTTFANEGKYAKPILVKSIKDKAGKSDLSGNNSSKSGYSATL